MLLKDLPLHQPATIAEIKTSQHELLNVFLGFGLLPGSSIVLVRKFPSFIVQSNNSQYTLDRQLASSVEVKV